MQTSMSYLGAHVKWLVPTSMLSMAQIAWIDPKGAFTVGNYFCDKGLKDFFSVFSPFIMIFYYLINKFQINKQIVYLLYQERNYFLLNPKPKTQNPSATSMAFLSIQVYIIGQIFHVCILVPWYKCQVSIHIIFFVQF